MKKLFGIFLGLPFLIFADPATIPLKKAKELFSKYSFEKLTYEKINIPFDQIELDIWQRINSDDSSCAFPDNSLSSNVIGEIADTDYMYRRIHEAIPGPLALEGTKKDDVILQSEAKDKCVLDTIISATEYHKPSIPKYLANENYTVTLSGPKKVKVGCSSNGSDLSLVFGLLLFGLLKRTKKT